MSEIGHAAPDDPVAPELSRRAFGSLVGGSVIASAVAPRIFGRSPSIQVPGPKVTCGVSAGDVTNGSGVIWSRSDRAARMRVEWATNDAFRDSRKLDGPLTRTEDDFTSKMVLSELPPGETIVYRVSFRDADSAAVLGEPVVGRFRTPSQDRAAIRFAWGGDVAGQGWGIDPRRGGMATFDAIRRASPDFFVHSGDHIYADNPIPPGFILEDETIWKNLQTEETAKVAETLDEFRGRYRYNYLDGPYRRFLASVSVLDQWDDHEVLNNWYPGEVLDGDPRYREKDVNVLAARARRAFLEYQPVRTTREDPGRIYRTVSYGPNLDVFLLDQRSYRGANSANRQTESGPASAFLGTAQLEWLKATLVKSKATWKVIASDMPLGLVIRDANQSFEAVANGDGPALGRELEIADLLRSMKQNQVRNVVWVTADVHYAAAHLYDPTKAKFTDFDPFWEFVAGPLHAGTFTPVELDNTFGPTVTFTATPPGMRPNQPPSAGFQFFGMVDISRDGRSLTVRFQNRDGKVLHTQAIDAQY